MKISSRKLSHCIFVKGITQNACICIGKILSQIKYLPLHQKIQIIRFSIHESIYSKDEITIYLYN